MLGKQVSWLVGGLVLTVAALPFMPAQQQQGPPPEAIQKMLEASKKWTAPSASHATLKRFVGKWDIVETINGMPAGKQTAEWKLVLGDRFVQETVTGKLFGMPYEALGMIGYDNFKHAFVWSWFDSFNTYKLDAQGLLDQSGQTLIFYGHLDEYLTGEVAKPVKYIYRFQDADHFTVEIHDLAIGETNTEVVHFTYTRAK